ARAGRRLPEQQARAGRRRRHRRVIAVARPLRRGPSRQARPRPPQRRVTISAMSNVNFSAGLPETVLPPDPLAEALAHAPDLEYADVAALVAGEPRSCLGWATLAGLSEDPMARYAFFRVGYHRGLDALRGAGWRGSGYVRSDHPSNLGFLRCLDGLRRSSAEIGELDEETRCAQFLA